jgi:hypothetical protein
MTDTTDDDLVKLLREVSLEKQQEAWARSDGGQDLTIGAMLADEAADRIEELEAKLAQAIDLSVRIISDPHWRTSDNALWKDLCNFRRVSLAKLKGQDDE